MVREDGRNFNEERKIKITKNINIYAEGSVLIEVGNTKVICTASVTDKVPSFLRGTGKGWVTAENVAKLIKDKGIKVIVSDRWLKKNVIKALKDAGSERLAPLPCEEYSQ